MNHLSNPKHKVEYGGAIDFKLDGTVEEISVRTGDTGGVDLPVDYEMLYHTHPDKKDSPPSPEDLLNLIEEKKQKVEMVVRDGNIFSIIMTPEAEKKLKGMIKGQREQIAWELLGGEISEKEAKNNLRRFGFKVTTRSKSDRGFSLDISPIETKSNKKQNRGIGPFFDILTPTFASASSKEYANYFNQKKNRGSNPMGYIPNPDGYEENQRKIQRALDRLYNKYDKVDIDSKEGKELAERIKRLKQLKD